MSAWRWAVVLAGCTVGPDYHRPRAPMPARDAYKEWKLARPADAIPRGHWWTMFGDPELHALELRLNVDNQNIVQAVDNYLVASAQVRAARADYWPTLSISPSASVSRGSSGGTGVVSGPNVVTGSTTTGAGSTATIAQSGSRRTVYSLPGDVSWAPDLFGRVRRTVRGRQYAAEQAWADLENTRLLEQSALAETYFELRGQDALVDLLQQTVEANQQIVNIAQASYGLGITSQADVLQAQLTLQTARVQLTNAGIARAQFEHAIATLLGIPAPSFSLPHRPLLAHPPAIPTGAPSQLLERRPDIAAAERAMAAANEAIGVGYAAYFPVLTLSGRGGFASTALDTLLHWPSRVWALGATLGETIFDGGLRRANIDQARAQYDASIALYRQTVLTAFQQVEDQLAALRILAVALEQQRLAVQMAQQSFEVERTRYQTGIDPYVVLMTQQTALLAARETLISLEVQQMTASVVLIQALGGGWQRQR